MPLSFIETMRGWLRGADGGEFPISFEVGARGVRAGRFELRGLLAAPPLTPETSAKGTLEMRLGSIAYHLDFVGEGQKRLHLDATKYPSLRAPLRSMTRMHTTIRDEAGRTVASGEMRFSLGDLLPFAASWLPWQEHGRRRLDASRRHLERRALVGPSSRTLLAAGEAAGGAGAP
jgi:hypothetical protein